MGEGEGMDRFPVLKEMFTTDITITRCTYRSGFRTYSRMEISSYEPGFTRHGVESWEKKGNAQGTEEMGICPLIRRSSIVKCADYGQLRLHR